MNAIFRKEISTFLNSLIAYLVIALFLTGVGLFTWVFPSSGVLEYGYADMATLFGNAPLIYLFLIPAITMRSFAEEKRNGTLEILLTKPLNEWNLLLGKYLASVVLVVFSILPTLIYYATLYWLGNPKGNIDTAGVFGSYIGLILLGASFAAVGILASALTENQIVSFVVGAFICFLLFFGLGSLADLDIWGPAGWYLSKLGMQYHYSAMSRGLVDSRNVLYFVSVAAISLTGTWLTLRSRLW